MLRDGALCQRQDIHDLPADAGAALPEQADDGHARGMTQGLGQSHERFIIGLLIRLLHRLSTINDFGSESTFFSPMND